jgi:hypothetical protein
MWLLLTGGVRRWLLLTVAVPLAGRLARGVAGALERHQGPNPVSKAMVKAADVTDRAHRKGSGPSPRRRRFLRFV